MASILRQIVAGPRARHPEAGLDLCYVTDTIIATSGPSGTYPQIAYRNPLKDLVSFLDSKHAENWAIWEFRAEGTGYPDDEVYGRIRHYPWPDHHPPPFALIPLIMGSMRNWLKEKDAEGRVVVVHCKAGKGRSGTVTCSYLISEEGWKAEDAKQRFTERRMRPGFGAGISIPSQIRTIEYVDRWTQFGKKYVERPAEVLEVHVWGLRDGVKIAVEGYVEEGKMIKSFHTFTNKEREIVRGGTDKAGDMSDVVAQAMDRKDALKDSSDSAASSPTTPSSSSFDRSSTTKTLDSTEGGDVIFRPSTRIVLPSSDINIDFERRNKTKFGGFTMVTSVAHVWFNIFFEGRGPEQQGTADDSGVFEIEWDAMDGIKGSARKGTKCFDRMAVVWKALDIPGLPSVQIDEPLEGEPVQEAKAADWTGAHGTKNQGEKKLGLRIGTSESRDVSRASSLKSDSPRSVNGNVPDEIDTVKSHGAGGLDGSASPVVTAVLADNPHVTQVQSPLSKSAPLVQDHAENQQASSSPTSSLSHAQIDGLTSGAQHLSTSDLPGGVAEAELGRHHEHAIGKMLRAKHHGSS
ncbi:hypothetical protein B0A48_16207 [Cryoendolithus antarcticus]|uniref:phosphatidylinositol-3,4,5-trisphosphate 3-phosphatase n=1 Tax=Cryoendolithus antarcticus TaxID=1507870 RepID=A0A1V8SFJ0_9PEZI|nr:hypothetical protein B0A48_16207 [Cryoendolithus antarcticus]